MNCQFNKFNILFLKVPCRNLEESSAKVIAALWLIHIADSYGSYFPFQHFLLSFYQLGWQDLIYNKRQVF